MPVRWWSRPRPVGRPTPFVAGSNSHQTERTPTWPPSQCTSSSPSTASSSRPPGRSSTASTRRWARPSARSPKPPAPSCSAAGRTRCSRRPGATAPSRTTRAPTSSTRPRSSSSAPTSRPRSGTTPPARRVRPRRDPPPQGGARRRHLHLRQRAAGPGLLAEGLVDDLHLFVYPIALGEGERFWADGEQHKLALKAHDVYDNGVVHLATAPPEQACQPRRRGPR